MPMRPEAGGPGIPLTGREVNQVPCQICSWCASQGMMTASPEVASLPARPRLSTGGALTSQLSPGSCACHPTGEGRAGC